MYAKKTLQKSNMKNINLALKSYIFNLHLSNAKNS